MSDVYFGGHVLFKRVYFHKNTLHITHKNMHHSFFEDKVF